MNIAKTGAAFGLAALTLASSLSIGEMANAASAKDSKAKSSKVATSSTQQVKLVFRMPDNSYLAITSRNGNTLPFIETSSLADARAAALTATVPATG